MLKTLSDYRNAILAATQAGCSWPAAVHSVLLARLKYELGPQFHSTFELWNKPTASWKDYILSREVNDTHMTFSHARDQQLTNDKLAFAEHCIAHELPTIPVICAIDRRPGLQRAEIPNGFELERWLEIMKTAPGRIFLKPINGAHGTGAFSASRAGAGWTYLDRTGSDRDLHVYCLENLQGIRGWIVQPAITPHADIAQKLSPAALCTVRMVTYMDKETPRLLFSVLRIPAGKSNTDNWSLGFTGNFVAAVDLEDGTVGPARTSRSKTWPVIYATDTHPDTGAQINGYRLPYWQEARELAIRAQRAFSKVPTLGWDIAITDAGPIIVETNCNYAVELVEVALQRGIRQDLAPTFSYPRVKSDVQ